MENKMLGVMVDCSRNAVMTVDAVKRLAKLLAGMGYNTLMLYTEDTYEVDGEPYFGYLRGRYSKEELKELDAYCRSIGIVLTPCIQTLAHLNAIFRWPEYADARDCDDILLIDSDRTYTLIEHIFATLAECFTTRRVHIGMDEAFKVGLGRYLEQHGYSDRFDLINRHLHRVCEIAAKYGFEAMIWSDMFCRLATNSSDYYSDSDVEKIRARAALPDNVSLVYWDYYTDSKERYTQQIRTNKLFGKPVYFAGGAWSWVGFAPDNDLSIRNTAAAMSVCREEGVDGIFFTSWGDDGGECSRFAILPALLYAAEAARGNEDMADIREKFHRLTGGDYDAFLLLDELNRMMGDYRGHLNKCLLYNDLLLGENDTQCTEEYARRCRTLREQLVQAAPAQGDYAYLFRTLAALCDVLADKTAVSLRLRPAYQTGDRAALGEIAASLPALEEKIAVLRDVFEEQWMRDNKPHGFDVQDLRLGGLLQRVKSVRRRLERYLAGELNAIPELEETILPHAGFYQWSLTASPNVI